MVSLNYEIMHIPVNEFSRPGYELLDVQAVVDHYTANPGAGVDAHYRYFSETVIIKKRYAGAHIFVDRYKAGEFIPLNEGAFGANDGGTPALKLQTLRARDPRYPTETGDGNANLLTIHVEMCVEPDGTIHPHTIARTILVHKMLQEKFPQLEDTYNRFVRHFDVTGKNCPAPMVKDPSKYRALLDMTDKKEEKNLHVFWDGMELKSSQLGRLTILKPINLWKRDKNDELHFQRILLPGERYRVYGYSDLYDGQYDVGAGYWVTKMDGYIKYETPSKRKLEELAKIEK
jgi:N-acetylmuramoyl-L-alanine amidase CwlA